jgi:O-acetyl-ADP-ribose deacetylase (regulator of RNase III)
MIYFFKGDATQPQSSPPLIIAHICNDIDKFGAGFSGALRNRWPHVEFEYHKWFNTDTLRLGKIRFIEIGKSQWVCHMIAQHEVRSQHNPSPML